MYSISAYLLFSTYIIIHASVLNIEELNSIHYSIDIVNSPVLKNQDWSSDIVTVTNKYGQEYICTLPEVQIPENENKKEEDLLDQLVDISELLKPMEAAPCLIKKKDWWTYEFCYGSVIKQYHLEDNKVVGTILILGKYESEYNWKNSSKTKNKLQKFHTQHYVNGTRCDITAEPRRAEVRFHCEEGVGDYVQQVDEPESCRYVIIIATTRVCHHPYLKPNPNRIPHNINCAPALSQDEFDQYQKVQEIKKAKLEKERQKLLELEKNSNGGTQSGDLVNVFGDNDTDEEDSKWSIKLVTIPISKKGKLPRNRMINSEDIESFKDESDVFSTSSFNDNDNILADKAQGFESVTSYLTENELLEREFNQILKDFTEDKEEDAEGKEDIGEAEAVKEGSDGKEDEDDRKVRKQFEAFRKRMENLMGRWMEIQNEDHIHVLLDKIKNNLDENVQKLEETANKFSDESLNEYLNDLLEMAEKYKKNLPKVEDLNLQDEQKVKEALKSLTNLLTEAEVGVLKAIQHKKKLDRLEKYLESQLKKTENDLWPLKSKEKELWPLKSKVKEDNELQKGEDEEEEKLDGTEKTVTVKTLEEEDSTPSDPGTPDTTSFSNPSATPSPPFPRRLEDPNDSEPTDEREGLGATEEEIVENSEQASGRNVKILNEKNIDEDRKLRLEQSIKEKLQKSGLDNIGRKIEVKILTPNYLDDDEKDSLSSLTQEETEAFHNMIVNILSASAEELQERERHKNLESNYNFRLEEPEINMNDRIMSDESPDLEELPTSTRVESHSSSAESQSEVNEVQEKESEVPDKNDNIDRSDSSSSNNNDDISNINDNNNINSKAET